MRAAQLSALLFSSLLSGCGGHPCTLVGCGPSVWIEFPPVSGDGSYVFRLSEGDRTWSCEGPIPPPASGSLPPCEAGMAVSGPAVVPPQPFAYTTLWLETARPRRPRLVIERDGEPVFDRTFELTYAVSTPNGPDCAPVCSTASVTLEP